nr:triosephosphate isomerase [Gemmatimonadota bacterium]
MTHGRLPLMAANWKMHFRSGEAARYLAEFLEPGLDRGGCEVLFCVPASLLGEAVAAARGTDLRIGAQNMHWEDAGAFTGEISGPMIASVGATHCLVGHSERRHVFGEDDAVAAQKLRAALRNGIRPVLCVGERIEERRGGHAETVVAHQVRRALEGLAVVELEKVALAYEPVWAIGTGETATPEIARHMHGCVREALAALH